MFQVFAPVDGDFERFDTETRDWIARHPPLLGIVHGDPRQPEVSDTIAALNGRSAAFLVGGLSAARGAPLQIAGRVVEGGLSGILLSPEIAVATGLSQGCSPIGPVRHVSEADGNIILALDGRPALDVFKDDIGELLSRDLRRVAGLIFAGFPIAGSDTGDYLVRNLVAIDVEHSCLAVAHEITPGDPVLFCRRDTPSAIADLRRMLEKIKQRAAATPRGGLYFSCVGAAPICSVKTRKTRPHPPGARRFPAGRLLRQRRDLERSPLRLYRRARGVPMRSGDFRWVLR